VVPSPHGHGCTGLHRRSARLALNAGAPLRGRAVLDGLGGSRQPSKAVAQRSRLPCRHVLDLAPHRSEPGVAPFRFRVTGGSGFVGGTSPELVTAHTHFTRKCLLVGCRGNRVEASGGQG
jgi:hypothetical protein